MCPLMKASISLRFGPAILRLFCESKFLYAPNSGSQTEQSIKDEKRDLWVAFHSSILRSTFHGKAA